jgi:hypothetical protein
VTLLHTSEILVLKGWLLLGGMSLLFRLNKTNQKYREYPNSLDETTVNAALIESSDQSTATTDN